MNIGLLGASGRVGQILVDLITKNEDINLSAVFIKNNKINLDKKIIQTNNMNVFLNSCDLVIDFSLPKGTEEALSTILNDNIKTSLVIATTGLNEHQKNLMLEASKISKILYASNMSFGVGQLGNFQSTHTQMKTTYSFSVFYQ